MLLRGKRTKRAEKWPIIGWWWHHPRRFGYSYRQGKKIINRRQSKKPPSLRLRGLMRENCYLLYHWILKYGFVGLLCDTLQIKDVSRRYLVMNMSLWTAPDATDIVRMVLPKICVLKNCGQILWVFLSQITRRKKYWAYWIYASHTTWQSLEFTILPHLYLENAREPIESNLYSKSSLFIYDIEI